MDVELWQLMLGVSGLLVVIGIVATVWGLEPLDIASGLLFLALVIIGGYIGWRVGQSLGR